MEKNNNNLQCSELDRNRINTEDDCVALNMNDCSITANMGCRGTATNTGEQSIAISIGNNSTTIGTGKQSISGNVGFRGLSISTGKGKCSCYYKKLWHVKNHKF